MAAGDAVFYVYRVIVHTMGCASAFQLNPLIESFPGNVGFPGCHQAFREAQNGLDRHQISTRDIATQVNHMVLVST